MKSKQDMKQTYGVDDIYFYYLRNIDNRPYVAVCLLRLGDEYARGISICSPRDIFMKKTGRKVAKDRALKALFTKQDEGAILRDEPTTVLDNIDVDTYINFEYKQEYMPEFTLFEKKLLGLVERNMN